MLGSRTITPSELAELGLLVERRARREPLQYILGEWGFRRLVLAVDARALIPRPETEIVVERVLALIEGATDPRVLDVGTGSGAIALAVADEHPGSRVTGIDSSAEALALARENAARCGLRLELERRDLFDGLPAGALGRRRLQPALRPARRPRRASTGGPGLGTRGGAVLRRRDRPTRWRGWRGKCSRKPGRWCSRSGDGEGRRRLSCTPSLGYRQIRVTSDLSGRERVVEGRR